MNKNLHNVRQKSNQPSLIVSEKKNQILLDGSRGKLAPVVCSETRKSVRLHVK